MGLARCAHCSLDPWLCKFPCGWPLARGGRRDELDCPEGFESCPGRLVALPLPRDRRCERAASRRAINSKKDLSIGQ
eukprot:7199711-Alexandrium_andersonii.AAC.1